jgi:hypothetical protein
MSANELDQLLETYQEVNMLNINEDAVRALNEWAYHAIDTLRTQAARIAELESGLPLRVAHGAQAVTSEKYKFRLAQLEQQIEELEKDASRYQKLRHMAVELSLSHETIAQLVTNQAELDAAISLQEGATK